jgi:secreted protein with Ig-like and vWFA domain
VPAPAAAAAPAADAPTAPATASSGPLQEQQITSGLRSGSYAVSSGAIDSLLFPKVDNNAGVPHGVAGVAQTAPAAPETAPASLGVTQGPTQADVETGKKDQAQTQENADVDAILANKRRLIEQRLDDLNAQNSILNKSASSKEDIEAKNRETKDLEQELSEFDRTRATEAGDRSGGVAQGREFGMVGGAVSTPVVRAQPIAPADGKLEARLEYGAPIPETAPTPMPAARFNLGTQQTTASVALNDRATANLTVTANVTAKSAQTAKIPILGDIPLLGRAFRSNPQQAQLPAPLPQDELSAADQPYSTFSLHVSDVSFLLASASLANGQLPDPDSIRPEEFYNAFDYGDPAPATGEKIACNIEQAAHPLLQQRNLVRIAMKVAATGRGQGQPLRLTVLLDTSGSMEREDRAASVQRAMQVLTSLLGPGDAVTLIGFARQPRLLAEAVPGDQAGKLVDIVKRTPAEGGTNMEEALKAASELALKHLVKGGQNRVVMLTDGAANLGDADPAQLSKLVESLRQQGVSFDACGVGANGLNDDILEALTRKGGGRYYFLNEPEDADAGFARQLAGAFRPAAENVKMQVRFNPARVGNYRLIGFEKNRLKQEDFRNDKVTAAQLAAEEAGVALYQVQVLPEGEGEIGEVFVRFLDPNDGRVTEQSWTIPYDPQAPALDQASPSMQLATTAALIAEKLRGGPLAEALDMDALAPIVGRLRGDYAGQTRVQDLATMFEQARRMTAHK